MPVARSLRLSPLAPLAVMCAETALCAYFAWANHNILSAFLVLLAPALLGLGLLGFLAPDLRKSSRRAVRGLGRALGVLVVILQAGALALLCALRPPG